MCNESATPAQVTITLSRDAAVRFGELVHNMIESEAENVNSAIQRGYYAQAAESANELVSLIELMNKLQLGG